MYKLVSSFFFSSRLKVSAALLLPCHLALVLLLDRGAVEWISVATISELAECLVLSISPVISARLAMCCFQFD